MGKRSKTNPVDRFLAKIDFHGPWFKEDRCWLWTAATNGIGYGKLSVEDALMYAHRFSYLLHVGAIPCGYPERMAKRTTKPTDVNARMKAVVDQATADDGIGPQLEATVMPTPQRHPARRFVPDSQRVG